MFSGIAGKGFGSHKQWNSCLTCLYGCQSSVWSLQCFVSMVCDKHCYLNRCVTPGAPRDVVVGEAGMVSHTTTLYEIILASNLYVGCFEIRLSILMQCLQINLYVVIICFLMIKHFDWSQWICECALFFPLLRSFLLISKLMWTGCFCSVRTTGLLYLFNKLKLIGFAPLVQKFSVFSVCSQVALCFTHS